MLSYLASFAVLALAASAQVMINTPAALTECQPVLLSWSGGSSPYFIAVLPAGQTSANPIEQFQPQTGNSYTWIVDLPAGTAISLRITDSAGNINYGSPVTIQAGTSTSCINQNANTAGATGTSIPTVTGGVSGPAAGALPSGLYGFSQSGIYAYPSAVYSQVGSASGSGGDNTYAVVQGSATGALVEGPSAYQYSASDAYASCSVSGSQGVCVYSNSAGATTFTAPFGPITATAAPARRLRFARDV